LNTLFSLNSGLPAIRGTRFAKQRFPCKFSLSGPNSACFGPIKGVKTVFESRWPTHGNVHKREGYGSKIDSGKSWPAESKHAA
jgi:hypothetical protein